MNLPQDGIKLHRGNFTAIGRQIQPYLEDGKCFRMVLKPWRERRSLSQNALSHMWYSEISEYLISRGKTFATPAWVKDALKHTYLGYETKELVDVVTGEITTIQSLRHTSNLDTGEMYVFLCKVEALGDEYWLPPDYSAELRVPAAPRQAGGVMATPLIRVMNGHIYRVSNRRKRKPELKPSEIPTLLGYTASPVDKKWLRLAARRNHG